MQHASDSDNHAINNGVFVLRENERRNRKGKVFQVQQNIVCYNSPLFRSAIIQVHKYEQIHERVEHGIYSNTEILRAFVLTNG